MDNPPLKKESEAITEELIETAIRQKEQREDIFVKELDISPGCNGGVNFESVVFSVKALVQKGEIETTHHLFLKIPHKEGHVREGMEKTINVFTIESHAYTDVIPAMIRIQAEKGLEPVRPPVPLHYHSIVEKNGGIVILEDLKQKGFVLPDKAGGLDEAHCKLVMRDLANFHVLSFALKNGNPENMKKFSTALQEVLFLSPLPEFLADLIDLSLEMVKECSSDKKVIAVASKLNGLEFIELMKQQIQPIEPYAVICHGDLWFNNLLFKYDVQDDEKIPIDMRLVDLQELRYALPSVDLTCFFYTSTTQPLRKKHLKNLLTSYHAHFVEGLKRLNIHFPDFTLEVVEQLFKRHVIYGIGVSCVFMSPIVAAEQGISESSLLQDKRNHNLIKHLLASEENRRLIQERLVAGFEEAIGMGLL